MSTEDSIPHVHDRTFRNAMSDLRVSRDIISHYLPLDAKALVDLHTLKSENGTFVDEDLQLFVSDMLFSVRYKDQANLSLAYVYLLTEHFSSQHRLNAWQIAKYTFNVINQKIDKKTKTLPLVIPLVIYNGKHPYVQPTSIYDLFDKPAQALAKKYVFNEFQLVDLTQIPDETIRTHRWSVILETLFKHAHSRDMMAQLESLMHVFSRLAHEQADSYILAMLKYYLETSPDNEVERFKAFLHRALPKPLEDKVMTLAQYLRKEGYEEGVQKGSNLTCREIAKNLLKLTNNNIELCIQATGLTYNELEKLRGELA